MIKGVDDTSDVLCKNTFLAVQTGVRGLVEYRILIPDSMSPRPPVLTCNSLFNELTHARFDTKEIVFPRGEKGLEINKCMLVGNEMYVTSVVCKIK